MGVGAGPGETVVAAGEARGSAMLRIVRVLSIVLAAGLPAAAAAEDFIRGKLLVAAPSMPDPRFAETVIYMCVHDTNGAFGLVVNRRMGMVPGGAVVERLGIEADASEEPVPVHWGGPVASGLGFVLHTDDYASESTVPVADGVAFSTDSMAVADLASGRGAARALLAFGYAGWSPGQLEGELARDDWVVVPAEAALVFGEDPEATWRAALDREEVAL